MGTRLKGTYSAGVHRRNKHKLRKTPVFGASILDGLPQRGSRYLTVVQLVNRDGEACYLCGERLRSGNFHVEHIIPKSRGGTDNANNLALACSPCNRRKYDLPVSFLVSDRTPVFHLK